MKTIIYFSKFAEVHQTFFPLNKLQFIRPYNNYTNNISILKLWAEIVMGRNGPIWLWAEMTSDPHH